MPLFAENRARSAIAAIAAVGVGHVVTKLLVSPHSSQLLQSLVAVLAIGGLVGMVIMHHRREGQLMTQTQEEAALIGGLALLWIVLMVSWNLLSGPGGNSGGHRGYGGYSGGRQGGGPYGWRDEYIVEEYMW